MFKRTPIMYVIAFAILLNVGYTFTDETNQFTNKIQQELHNCGYTPACIQSLDKIYPKSTFQRKILDEILMQHYYDEAKNTLTDKTPQEQIGFLEQELTSYMLSPGAIARGQEGPCLVSTDDGSDRGIKGRRYTALSQLKKEIENKIAIQEKP